MVIRLVIADRDSEYVERLVRVLEQREDLNISEYSDPDSLGRAIENNKMDILLFSEDMVQDFSALEKVPMPILLVDETGSYPTALDNTKKLRKYQRISSLYREMLTYYSEVAGNMRSFSGSENRARIISFYSPVGGSGKTTLSLAAALDLSRKGKTAIYLNFEHIASDGEYLPQNGSHGISELAAALDDNINFTMKLQGLLQEKSSGFFYMNHFDTPRDLTEITADEIERLVGIVAGSGLFDYVILDMDSVLNEKTGRLLALSDDICVVTREGQVTREKLNRFYSFSYMTESIAGKERFVVNQVVTSAQGQDAPAEPSARIRLVPETDESRIIDRITQSAEFDRLVDELL